MIVEGIISQPNNRPYIASLLIIAVIVGPVLQLRQTFQYKSLLNNYMQSMNKQLVQQANQIQIAQLYPLLAHNPFQGTWQSSIKRSEYLKQEQGKIQVRTIYNQSESVKSYEMKILIYDGWYIDQPYYQLTINTASIKVKGRYQPGKLLYQTVSPLISYYKAGNGVKLSLNKSIYINKLKFKISALFQNQADYQIENKQKIIKQIKLQILISSEYSINVIGRDIFQNRQTLNDILFAFLLMIQFLAQGYGIHSILQSITNQDQNIIKYSKAGFLFAFAFDTTQAIALTFICFISKKKVAVFGPSILILWLVIVLIQLKILSILFQDLYAQSPIKFCGKVYAFFTFTCILCYLLNFHPLFFIFISIIAMFPQIYNNYMVGHSLKNNLRGYFLYVLPRYAFIPYLKMYKYNVFNFQPNYVLCIFCFVLLTCQAILILLQVNYGVRSIVPKFLHPEELKYFLNQIQNQTQDDTCSICLVSLKQKAQAQPVSLPQLNQKSDTDHSFSLQAKQLDIMQNVQQIQNNIVLTPCKHKFHIECLTMSMKNKAECPNCRAKLPPLEQYQ